MEDTTFNLNDNTIAHIAKILQVSLLTGTDIIDHLRMIRLKSVASDDDSSLVLESDYARTFDLSIDKMLENANQKTSN
tara:strand:- start:882 stop:1115 length:234 start_codon:yes stop_codon:yes gene_type:complete